MRRTLSLPALHHLAVAAHRRGQEIGAEGLELAAHGGRLLERDGGAVHHHLRHLALAALGDAGLAEAHLLQVLAGRDDDEDDVAAGKFGRASRRCARPALPAARPSRACGSRSRRNGPPSAAVRPWGSPCAHADPSDCVLCGHVCLPLSFLAACTAVDFGTRSMTARCHGRAWRRRIQPSNEAGEPRIAGSSGQARG